MRNSQGACHTHTTCSSFQVGAVLPRKSRNFRNIREQGVKCVHPGTVVHHRSWRCEVPHWAGRLSEQTWKQTTRARHTNTLEHDYQQQQLQLQVDGTSHRLRDREEGTRKEEEEEMA